jgi:hypothetical protein
VALTTAVEMLLDNAELTESFDEKRAVWLEAAKKAYEYTAETIPNPPRPDDVAPHLALALEANDEFLKVRTEKSVRQKHWLRDFADLILDRLWPELMVEEE